MQININFTTSSQFALYRIRGQKITFTQVKYTPICVFYATYVYIFRYVLYMYFLIHQCRKTWIY